jgi:two-component system sensor histidine kinase PilS (NtrC family)
LLFFRLLLAIFFLVVTMIVTTRRGGDLLSAHLQPLFFFSAILFLFTIVAALTLKHFHNLNLRRFGYIQLFFDVEAVTGLIYLSGGVESLFSFLYMPVIISAALMLYRRGSVLTASVCSLSYGLLLDLQYFGWIKPLQIVAEASYFRSSSTYFHSLLMNIACFYLVAYLCGYLAEELQRSSRQVRKQKKDFHQLEILHQNIVQSMSSGLLTLNPTGYVLFSNRAAERILRIPADQLRGQPYQDIFPALKPMVWPGSISPEMRSNPPDALNQMEVTYKAPGGERLCLGYTVCVLQSEDGEASGWIFIFQDLTSMKAMEEHLQRMERLAFAGRIASEIAHEIKNPLAAMSGAVQMLQTEVEQDSLQTRLMNIVEREINRINDLVTDFLWLARGSMKPEKIKDVDLCDIIQEVLALLKTRDSVSSSHRIRTDFRLTPTFPMDPHHFRQILWNLLVNALEAMPDGGDLCIRVDICEDHEACKHEARIDVQDSGCGISEEVRSRVFEPFFTTKKNGTGLGLSIVYQLVENAGGRLQVSHHEGHGTTFSLFFPIVSSFPLAN